MTDDSGDPWEERAFLQAHLRIAEALVEEHYKEACTLRNQVKKYRTMVDSYRTKLINMHRRAQKAEGERDKARAALRDLHDEAVDEIRGVRL